MLQNFVVVLSSTIFMKGHNYQKGTHSTLSSILMVLSLLVIFGVNSNKNNGSFLIAILLKEKLWTT